MHSSFMIKHKNWWKNIIYTGTKQEKIKVLCLKITKNRKWSWFLFEKAILTLDFKFKRHVKHAHCSLKTWYENTNATIINLNKKGHEWEVFLRHPKMMSCWVSISFLGWDVQWKTKSMEGLKMKRQNTFKSKQQ